MPDFVATYLHSGPPPEGWKQQLEKFAADSGVKASASIVGNRSVIHCRVPERPAERAGAVAKAFFDEAAATMTGSSSGTWVRLVITEPVEPRSLWSHPFVAAGLGLGFVALTGALTLLLLSSDPATLTPKNALNVVFAVMAFAFVCAEYFMRRMAQTTSRSRLAEQKQQAEAETLAKEISKDEDPKQTLRIEAARVSLRMRAGRMRRDADQLWERSVYAYRGALLFYLLSIAGPGTAATLLLTSGTLDWHLMFSGFGLAAVPLTIGTALLRHDTKLREQYREAARDVATLERYELALDYARIGAQPSYDATLQQVITQLLTLPPATSGAAAAGSGGNQDGGEAAATAVATKLIEAATSILGQKK